MNEWCIVHHGQVGINCHLSHCIRDQCTSLSLLSSNTSVICAMHLASLVPVKDNCALFAPTPLFSGPGYLTMSFKFFPWRPLLSWQQIWDKIDYNSAPAKDNCMLFSPTPYFQVRAMQLCDVNFSPEDPCCHGNQPFLFKDKIGCVLTRASNAETQLLGYTAWQWDSYLVPQNVFLVYISI